MADRPEAEMDELTINCCSEPKTPDVLRAVAEESKAGAVAFIETAQHGVDINRADLEKLRDWINDRLEETKPQPGEVWELRELEDSGPYLFHGVDALRPWTSINGLEPGTWACSGRPTRRVGRIVYDDD